MLRLAPIPCWPLKQGLGRTFAATLGLGFALWVTGAKASPGQGHFLSGIEAQGPASTQLSAVFHNPAMLTDLPGLHLQLSLQPKIGTQRIAPAQRDAQGQPLANAFEPWQTHRNLGADAFLGASFLFENFAIAAAYYTLDGKFQETAPPAYSSFVRSNPAPYCRLDPGKSCPASSTMAGWAAVRSEFTLAIAWQTIRRLRLGLSLHFPRYSLRGGRTREPAHEPTSKLCARFYPNDPQCQEVEQYRFRTRWTGEDPAGSRVQLGMTLGVAWAPNDRWTFGARYRVRPNFGLRNPVYQGHLRGCAVASSGEVQCERLEESDAQLVERPGRQVALGASFRPFGDRRLHIDLQSYWLQNCPDRQRGRGCQALPDAQITVLGTQQHPRLVDRPWYRGRMDRWGAELWVHRSLQRSPKPRWRRFAYTAGLGGYSAQTYASAQNPIDNEGTTFFGAGSISIEILRRNSSMFLVGGYALALQRIRKVGPGAIPAAFLPGAFQTVQSTGQGIDGPDGQALMTGRARASNAGRYHSLMHTASLSLRWGARE